MRVNRPNYLSIKVLTHISLIRIFKSVIIERLWIIEKNTCASIGSRLCVLVNYFKDYCLNVLVNYFKRMKEK